MSLSIVEIAKKKFEDRRLWQNSKHAAWRNFWAIIFQPQ